jgi:hypothetical protein
MDELAGMPDNLSKLARERFHLLQPHLEQSQPLEDVTLAAGIHIEQQPVARAVSTVWLGVAGRKKRKIAANAAPFRWRSKKR